MTYNVFSGTLNPTHSRIMNCNYIYVKIAEYLVYLLIKTVRNLAGCLAAAVL